MKAFQKSLILICTLLAPWCVAGTVADLYRAQLPVESSAQPGSPPTQAQLQQALSQVLVKVSGQRNLSSHKQLQPLLANAAVFMQQYRYAEATAEQTAALSINFNPQAIDELVTQAGFKPLGPQRPTVLLWIASDQQGEQNFALAESPLFKAIEATAATRGLPLQWPLYDLTDQTTLLVSDLWGLFNDPIEQASARYRPDAVVAVRFKYAPSGIVTMDGILLSGREPVRFTSAGEAPVLAQELINKTADQLLLPVINHRLSDYQSGLAIQVDNILSLADYDTVVTLLKALPVTSTVKPEKVQADRITLRVELAGNQAQLLEAIALDPRMQALDLSNPQSLQFYWQP